MIILVLAAAGLLVFLLNFFRYSGSIISLSVALVYLMMLLVGSQGLDQLLNLLMAFYSGVAFLIGTSATLVFNYARHGVIGFGVKR
jgi:hypothetical protein